VPDRPAESSTSEGQGPAFLQLTFLISAYNTAQRMIWFSDQKASFIVIYYGILLSMLGTRVERLLAFFRAPEAALAPRVALALVGCAFVASMVYSLSYAIHSVVPTYAAPVDVRDYRRLYWCHDVLAKDVETYFESLRGLDAAALLKEMTRELYAAVGIERLKFDRVTRSLKGAAASFVAWVLVFVSTFFL
jgi:hypothetical protein